MPNAHLHLYDKAEREGRKLGHINVLSNSAEELFEALGKLEKFLPK